MKYEREFQVRHHHFLNPFLLLFYYYTFKKIENDEHILVRNEETSNGI